MVLSNACWVATSHKSFRCSADSCAVRNRDKPWEAYYIVKFFYRVYLNLGEGTWNSTDCCSARQVYL